MDIPRSKREKSNAALLGLAFDHEDEQKRVTRGPNFLLAGGSQETHAKMQETAIKINERLDQKCKQLAEISTEELRDMVEDLHG